jgi:hypothetical protein
MADHRFTSRRRAGFFVSSLALALAVTSTALVDRPALAGETESKTLFAEARQLRADGKCAEAIIVFRRALDTYPEGLGALRNIAECEQEIGMLASARRDWNDLRVAVLQSNTPKYEGWDKDADDARHALDGRVAKVIIKVVGNRPDGMRISVNGKSFDPRLLGVEIEEDNGPFRVEVQYGASTPVTKEVVLKDASRETLELNIPKYVPETPTGPSAEDIHRANKAKAMRIAGGVFLGVGSLAAIGFGVALGIEQTSLSSIEDVCPKLKGCPASVQDDIDRGQLSSTLVNVFAVTAGVGVGLGLTLVLAAPSSKTKAEAPAEKKARDKSSQPTHPEPHKTSLGLGIGPIPGGAAVGFGGTF